MVMRTGASGAADRSRVNVNEPYDLRHWAKRFGCTHTELRGLVKAAGPLATDIEKHLAGLAAKRERLAAAAASMTQEPGNE